MFNKILYSVMLVFLSQPVVAQNWQVDNFAMNIDGVKYNNVGNVFSISKIPIKINMVFTNTPTPLLQDKPTIKGYGRIKGNNINKYVEASNIDSKQKRWLKAALDFKNTPYKYGGNSKNGADCSYFTQEVYNELGDSHLPRSTVMQMKLGSKVSVDRINVGDLVFFKTNHGANNTHVGIVIDPKSKSFLHLSSSGLKISGINQKYWSKKLIAAVSLPHSK